MTPQELLNLSSQQIFELASNHLIQQGQQSWNSALGTCAYRINGNAKDPIRCAVGFFIPDNLYFQDMEGSGVTGLIETLEAVYPSDINANGQDLSNLVWFLEKNFNLLLDLQILHDSRNDYPRGQLSRRSSLKSLDGPEFDLDKLRANLIKLGEASNLDTSFLSQ